MLGKVTDLAEELQRLVVEGLTKFCPTIVVNRNRLLCCSWPNAAHQAGRQSAWQGEAISERVGTGTV